jgi:hypothetical protein
MKSKTRLSGSLARLHDTRLVGGGCGLWSVVRRRAASLGGDGLLLGYWATLSTAGRADLHLPLPARPASVSWQLLVSIER